MIEATGRAIAPESFTVTIKNFVAPDRWSDYEADSNVTDYVIGWAVLEWPDPPSLKVKLRSNGLPNAVEWLDG